MKQLAVFVIGCHLVACATGVGVDGTPSDAGGADGGMPVDRPGSAGSTGTGGTGTGGAGTGGVVGAGTGGAGTGGRGTGGAGTGGVVGAGTGGAGTGTGGRGTGGAGSGGTGTGGAPTGACDPLTNTGCAAGMKCTALQNGTAISLGCGTKGTKLEGASCMPILSGAVQTGDDCADGMACFSLQGETTPTCRQFCNVGGTGPACPATTTCTLQITSLPGPSFCRVTTSCLPLGQTGCPTGQGCYATAAGAVCAPAGTKRPGDACAAGNDCVRGSTCLTTNGVSTCASFCSTAAGGTPTCAATGTGGATCTVLPGTPPEPNAGACR